MSNLKRSYNNRIPKFESDELANLCGVLHQNIQLIEKKLQVRIKLTQDGIDILGKSAERINNAKDVIRKLHAIAKNPIHKNQVLSLLNNTFDEKTMPKQINLRQKKITTKNEKQNDYLSNIDKFDLNFAVGPAGTGKTYLAVAKAVEYFEKGEVERLIFVRPAVEAGEKLGFLPGDLIEKVLPYLRPIYDALYEMIGFKEVQKLIQNHTIEIVPLAFMRGRTLSNSFIILDEAQNATIMQMKMFLTRIGFGSKTVVTGDVTQVDLPKDADSGLEHAIKLFQNVDKIHINQFTTQEVVRHPLVSKIINYYETDQRKK